MRWSVLVRGFRGHPLHPPLTDATIGAFTVGTVAAVLSWLGVFVDVLAPTALGGIVIGLVFAVPTVVTGLADFLEIPADAPAKTVGLVHLGLMSVAAGGFFVGALLVRPVVDGGTVDAPAALVVLGSFLVLTAGGWVGGSLAYVYGVRVTGEVDTPPRQAIRPELERRAELDRETGRARPEAEDDGWADTR